jgi:hypothetical protein
MKPDKTLEAAVSLIERYCGTEDFGQGLTKTWAAWVHDFARDILAAVRQEEGMGLRDSVAHRLKLYDEYVAAHHGEVTLRAMEGACLADFLHSALVVFGTTRGAGG